MPTVSVPRDQLYSLLGKEYSQEEFELLCFDYGLELDDVVEEKPQIASRGASGGVQDSQETVVKFKIEVPANRYDLLCIEGLVQSLRVYIGAESPPTYTLSPKPVHSFSVDHSVSDVRPYVFCAVLRNLSITPQVYESLIDLQEKLHDNICRRRTLVAIGTHDLDTLQGPFAYQALPPRDISFVPLKKDQPYNAEELMELYEDDAQLKKYLHIIRDKPRFPVIYDANQTVLSLPPIINGNHSKVTLDTRNMLIECTATDRTKASIVLNVLVAMFSRYCETPFQVEPVSVTYSDGQTIITPDFSSPKVSASVEKINKRTGLSLGSSEILDMLQRMQLPAEMSSDGLDVDVAVPIVRPDILHECDIVCDVAIGFGFNNIEEVTPETVTVGRQQPLNHLSDLVRREGFAQQGYTEVLTWVTVSHGENFDLMRRKDDGRTAVCIGNPKTMEFQECRTSLLPGLLKTLRENRRMAVPMRMFEVGDVVLKDDEMDVGARNCRRAAAVYCGTCAGFEIMQGLVEHVMMVLGVVKGDGVGEGTWRIVEQGCEDGALFQGRRANIVMKSRVVGRTGWVHPQVLESFSLSYPISAMEVDLEPFLVEQTL